MVATTASYATATTATTTVVLSSQSTVPLGQSVTFTAMVSPSGATGTVQFSIDGVSFGAPVPLSGGSVTSSSISTLSIGTHQISATYLGDSNYSPSSGTMTQTISANNLIDSLIALFGFANTFTDSFGNLLFPVPSNAKISTGGGPTVVTSATVSFRLCDDPVTPPNAVACNNHEPAGIYACLVKSPQSMNPGGVIFITCNLTDGSTPPKIISQGTIALPNGYTANTVLVIPITEFFPTNPNCKDGPNDAQCVHDVKITVQGQGEFPRMNGGGRVNPALSTLNPVPPGTGNKNIPGTYILTHGFELHCNPQAKPNHLEVNFPHPKFGYEVTFHMDKLDNVLCVNNFTVAPNPPPNPPGPVEDTYTGVGEGRLFQTNGSPKGLDGCGATAWWTFTDGDTQGTSLGPTPVPGVKGEPGRVDRIVNLAIYDNTGTLLVRWDGNVLWIYSGGTKTPFPGYYLETGNHQFVPQPGQTFANIAPCPPLANPPTSLVPHNFQGSIPGVFP